jgi:hypothetical protein
MIPRLGSAARLGRSHGAMAAQKAVEYLATLVAAALSMVALAFAIIAFVSLVLLLFIAIAGPLPIPP